MHRAVALVALEEFQAQGLETFGLRGHGESGGDHGARATGNHVTNALVVDGRQAALGEHGLADGDEVRRRVEQGAVHVEEYCLQTHAHSSRRVWIM
ncbi:hypothetical protein D9M71_529730 [compost metagenome]